jgi:hypothetical protein
VRKRNKYSLSVSHLCRCFSCFLRYTVFLSFSHSDSLPVSIWHSAYIVPFSPIRTLRRRRIDRVFRFHITVDTPRPNAHNDKLIAEDFLTFLTAETFSVPEGVEGDNTFGAERSKRVRLRTRTEQHSETERQRHKDRPRQRETEKHGRRQSEQTQRDREAETDRDRDREMDGDGQR